MRAFLGIIYIISINKLSITKIYWKCGHFIGNEDIRNVLGRSRVEDISGNPRFLDNTKDDKVANSKGYKVRSLINHFNDSFSRSFSNDDSQSINQHVVKFNGWLSMKQYVKYKPIKWGFKFWYCFDQRNKISLSIWLVLR